MAKQKKAKMKPADAVQVLANEVNQLKSVLQPMTQDLMQTRAFLQEVASVLENYIRFERVAASLDITRQQSLAVYLLKHIDGFMAYIKGYKSQREDVRGRITDIIVYLMLLWAMVEEEES